MLTDFGQSRASNYSMSALQTTAYDNLKGTAHWMAYELLDFLDRMDSQVVCTKESDMWAFGMVIYVSPFPLLPRSLFNVMLFVRRFYLVNCLMRMLRTIMPESTALLQIS